MASDKKLPVAKKSKSTTTATLEKTDSQPKNPRAAAPKPRLTLANALRPKRHKAPKPPRPTFKPVTGAPHLFARSLRLLRSNWKLFATILVIYAVLYVILVGLSNGGLSTVKSSLNQNGDHTGQLAVGFTLFSALLSSSGSGSNASASMYQTFLLIIMSLVIIWALRQIYAKEPIRARDAFYRGTYPLIPSVLVLLVVLLELVPLALGAGLYTITVSSGIVQGALENLVVLAIFIVLAWGSLYMLCSSLFALYIVTLPDMTPMKALKSARGLVRYRRLVILRKLLFLPLVLVVLGMAVLIPISLYITVLASLALLLLTVIGVAVAHSYMYALYRELL